MAAAINMPLPRLPIALANYQDAHPLVPKRKEPLPQVLGNVIALKAMCAKWWLEKVQYCLRRDISKYNLFSLQRYLLDLPREIRSNIVHNALKSGGLHLAHGLKEIASVNKALVFLSSDIEVRGTIYITIPKPGVDLVDCPPDLELLIRSGEGVRDMNITFPVYFSDSIKRILNDICRTSRRLSYVTLHEACDEVVTIITRYCSGLQKLDLSGSRGVTDEGISRAIVNLKWTDKNKSGIKYFDVGNTSITEEGLMQLILRLPTITSFGSVDIVEALESLKLMSGDDSLITSIEETTLKCATVNRIQTLKKCCPNLNSINVTFQEHPGADLNDLRLFRQLAHVNITVREPFLLAPSHLQDFAWALGHQLKTLKVSGDVFWEADLGSLAAHCPSLLNIALPAITVPTKQSLVILQAKETPTLKHLVEIEFDCMSGVGPKAWAKDFNLVRQALVVVLQRCHLLKRLVLRPTCLVDTDFIEVLSENRLLNLEVLELYNSVVSLSCAKLIVDTCVNLHVMKGIRTWRGMTLQDIVMLRKYTRGHRREADLKIVP